MRIGRRRWRNRCRIGGLRVSRPTFWDGIDDIGEYCDCSWLVGWLHVDVDGAMEL